MIYGPRILNLRLCFMKGCVIRYTRSTLLISVLHSQIVWGGTVLSWTSYDEECGHSIIWKYQDLR